MKSIERRRLVLRGMIQFLREQLEAMKQPEWLTYYKVMKEEAIRPYQDSDRKST